MKKERVYISGAITSDPNYKEHFAKAARELEAKGFATVNPAQMEVVFPDAEYEDYMLIDLQILSKCDSIYMLNNWRKSCGANREFGYALGRGIKIMYEQEETE